MSFRIELIIFFWTNWVSLNSWSSVEHVVFLRIHRKLFNSQCFQENKVFLRAHLVSSVYLVLILAIFVLLACWFSTDSESRMNSFFPLNSKYFCELTGFQWTLRDTKNLQGFQEIQFYSLLGILKIPRVRMNSYMRYVLIELLGKQFSSLELIHFLWTQAAPVNSYCLCELLEFQWTQNNLWAHGIRIILMNSKSFFKIQISFGCKKDFVNFGGCVSSYDIVHIVPMKPNSLWVHKSYDVYMNFWSFYELIEFLINSESFDEFIWLCRVHSNFRSLILVELLWTVSPELQVFPWTLRVQMNLLSSRELQRLEI